jgi:hypothetical protein
MTWLRKDQSIHGMNGMKGVRAEHAAQACVELLATETAGTQGDCLFTAAVQLPKRCKQGLIIALQDCQHTHAHCYAAPAELQPGCCGPSPWAHQEAPAQACVMEGHTR